MSCARFCVGLYFFWSGEMWSGRSSFSPRQASAKVTPCPPSFSPCLRLVLSLYCGAMALRCGSILMMHCISCSWTVLTQTVQSVLDDFTEFGAFTGLRLHLHKMKALLQGVGLWPVQLLGIQVVSSVQYLVWGRLSH